MIDIALRVTLCYPYNAIVPKFTILIILFNFFIILERKDKIFISPIWLIPI